MALYDHPYDKNYYEKNANGFTTLIWFLDDWSLSLIMREAPNNVEKKTQVLKEHCLSKI